MLSIPKERKTDAVAKSDRTSEATARSQTAPGCFQHTSAQRRIFQTGVGPCDPAFQP
jgi:hypothetical protein